MLQAKDLELDIGDRKLLQGVSFTLSKGQKVGLVGRNGQGKTTLLRVLCGMTECSAGQINVSRGFRIAYLPQELVTPEKVAATVYQEAEKAFAPLLEKKRRAERLSSNLEKANAGDPSHESILSEHDRLHEELVREGYYSMGSRIEAVLAGLGFTRETLHVPISSLSGGWIMRMELAKILLALPDLILLDEPTNHLDLPSLSWLEKFLEKEEAGCLIVSHDRAFLDNVVSQIWELEHGRLQVFNGNYSFYESEKTRRLERQKAVWKNQQRKIGELNRFIDRFRSKATKARQVQSRVKQLEKIAPVDLAELGARYSFNLPMPERSGKVVLEIQGLSKGFGGRPLFSDLSFMMQRGSKLAVVGPNGAGKSTFLRILAGRQSPDSGRVITGHNVKVAYFAQHQGLELDYERSVFENIVLHCKGLSETKLRTILGIFMFRDDDVHKKASVLSGGEKSRLALAIIMAKGANLLLLDEPTNHLDMNAQDAVRRALSNFEGSVIVVSHDRYFLDGFVDHVLEICHGETSLFPGNVSEFLAMKGASWENPRCIKDTRVKEPTKKLEDFRAKDLSKREKKRVMAELRQEKSRRLMPFRRETRRIEGTIGVLEKEKEQMERLLSDPGTYTCQEKAGRLGRRYREINKELEDLYILWEKAYQALEELRQEFDERITEMEAR